MPLDFRPTPHQTGHAIGLAVAHLADQLSEGVQEAWLAEAVVSPGRYRAEIFLLSASAALYALESSGLPPAIESEVASGIFCWAKELDHESRDLLLAELDDATDYYAQAAVVNQNAEPALQALSDLEAAFGDRLLALGQNTRVRGQACARLCLVIPKVLWPAQYSAARQMLSEASLLSLQ